MIEVTPAMWEEKAKMARGETPFVEDKICDELLALSLPEFRKYPPRWQSYAGVDSSLKCNKWSFEEYLVRRFVAERFARTVVQPFDYFVELSVSDL